MKKAYNKPELFVESFQLTQSIASTCSVEWGGNTLGKPGHNDQTSCGWDMGNMVMWTESVAQCTTKIDEATEAFGLCYNTPNGGNSIFGS